MFKNHIIQTALLAFSLAVLIALTWSYLARHMYNYNMSFPVVYGVSIFPVIAWTLALTAGYFAINWIMSAIGPRRVVLRLSLVFVFSFIAVICVETVGYHLAGIQNIGTRQYPGLPLCDCLHAPWWMQLSYFMLGPIHWIATEIFLRHSASGIFSQDLLK